MRVSGTAGLLCRKCFFALEFSFIVQSPDAYLYKLNNDDEWVHIRTANKVCFVSNSCTADRTIDNPADGDYHLMYCFRAFSFGSSWPYSCFYAYCDIP